MNNLKNINEEKVKVIFVDDLQKTCQLSIHQKAQPNYIQKVKLTNGKDEYNSQKCTDNSFSNPLYETKVNNNNNQNVKFSFWNMCYAYFFPNKKVFFQNIHPVDFIKRSLDIENVIEIFEE